MAARRSAAPHPSAAAAALASSNETLNTFLGSHKLSWMIVGEARSAEQDGHQDQRSSTCISATPRPGQPALAIPHTSPTSSTFTPVTRTRPLEAFYVTASTSAVLPSPTLSDDRLKVQAASPANIVVDMAQVPPVASVPLATQNRSPQSGPVTSGNPLKRPAENNVTSSEKRQRSSGSMQTGTNTPTQPVNGQARFVAENVGRQAVPAERFVSVEGTLQSPTPPAQMGTLPPTHQQQIFHHPASRAPLTPAPSPSYNSPEFDKAQSPINALRDNQIKKLVAITGSSKLGTGMVSHFTKRRLSTLLQAVADGDQLFLIIHQIYCLWSVNSNLVPEAIRDNTNFEGTMQYLGVLLSPNREIRKDILKLLSEFPAQLDAFALQSLNAGGILRGIQAIMAGLSNKDNLLSRLMVRGYPPMAVELRLSLDIRSPFLMDIVFESMYRQTWGWPWAGNNDIHNEIVTIYKNDVDILNSQLQSPFGINMAYHSQTMQAFLQAIQRLVLQNRNQAANISQASSTVVNPPQLQPRPLLAPAHTFAPAGNVQVAPNFKLTRPHQVPSQLNVPVTFVPQPSGHQTMPPGMVVQPSHQKVMSHTCFYPSRLAAPLSIPANPQPESALHQVHLRNPLLKDPDDLINVVNGPRLYRFIGGFALGPYRLHNQPRQDFIFDVQQHDYERIPVAKDLGNFGPPLLDLKRGHQMYRLKACLWPGKAVPTPDEIATADVSWATNWFLRLNGLPLETQRKAHNGRDLPIDITTRICSGVNVLSVDVNTGGKELSASNWALAVEIIDVEMHDNILAQVQSRIRPAADVRAALQARLGGAPPHGTAAADDADAYDDDDDDDDVVITSSTLTISLTDPITASPACALPVRSDACAHFEAFDLRTFLGSRPAERPAEPCDVDVWRCPLCRGDARPARLRVDGFMVEVRDELRRRGAGAARAIAVGADGEWVPLEGEGAKGKGGGGVKGEGRGAATPREVIDLSD